jgi:hypothetical protein
MNGLDRIKSSNGGEHDCRQFYSTIYSTFYVAKNILPSKITGIKHKNTGYGKNMIGHFVYDPKVDENHYFQY